MELDDTDNTILHIISEANTPSYKKQVADSDQLGLSPQTVSRRINKLHDAGYVVAVILTDANHNIGYELTDKGRDAVQDRLAEQVVQ